MLKPAVLAMSALLALAVALPVATTHASAAGICAATCTPGGGNPGGNPPGGNPPGGNPPPPGGNPPPNGGGSPVPAPDLPVSAADIHRQEMLISCRVPADEETTTNVRFRNIGTKEIPGGTLVYWQVGKTTQTGTFPLPHDLAVGGELTQADLLKLGVPTKTACLSKLIVASL